MARILVIEDNPANLELMSYLLKAFGHEVLTAVDGRAGLEAVCSDLPELIICDVHLPKMDGYEVAQRLKADPALKDIPLIAVTALAMVGDRDRGLAAGFDSYIYKPIEPETFVDEVERFLHVALRGETPAPAAASATGVSDPRESKRASVLVVDDSALNRKLMRSLLEPFGYEVWLTSSVVEAMARVSESVPDLIMSDVHMPDQDGFDLLRQIKASPGLANIPFLLISSTSWGEKDRKTARQLGADRFLLRPIELQELLDEITACLTGERQ